MKQLHVKQVTQLDLNADDNRRIDYNVTRVTNSTTPRINDILTPDQLVVYCESDDWQVTIT